MKGFCVILVLAFVATCTVSALPSRQLRIRQIIVPPPASEDKKPESDGSNIGEKLPPAESEPKKPEGESEPKKTENESEPKKPESDDLDLGEKKEESAEEEQQPEVFKSDAKAADDKQHAKQLERDDMEREVKEYLARNAADHDAKLPKDDEAEEDADEAAADAAKQDDEEQEKDAKVSALKPIVVADDSESHEHRDGKLAPFFGKFQKDQPKSADESIDPVEAQKDESAEERSESESRAASKPCNNEEIQRRIEAVIAELQEIKSLAGGESPAAEDSEE